MIITLTAPLNESPIFHKRKTMNFGFKVIVNFQITIYPERNFLWIIFSTIQNLYCLKSRFGEFQRWIPETVYASFQLAVADEMIKSEKLSDLLKFTHYLMVKAGPNSHLCALLNDSHISKITYYQCIKLKGIIMHWLTYYLHHHQ